VATPTACNSHSAARINTKPTTKIQKNLGLRWLRLGVVRFHRDSPPLQLVHVYVVSMSSYMLLAQRSSLVLRAQGVDLST
jgi:hypothetical protein